MIVSDSTKKELESIIQLIHPNGDPDDECYKKHVKDIKDVLVPSKTDDGEFRRKAIGEDDDWKALAR